MKKKLFALVLALMLVPAVLVSAAQAGFADSRMDGHYAVIGGEDVFTIRSHVELGGQGGYCQSLFAVELTGEETKAELDALARSLIEKGTEPVWGGSKHCYHGGAYTAEPEFTLRASDWAPGSYLYVCYAFGCEGGSYNHYLVPCYERISTMAVRVTEEAEAMDLRCVLTDSAGGEVAVLTDGETAELDLNGGTLSLALVSGTEHPAERVVEIRADFDPELAAAPFVLDGDAMTLEPVFCGSGSITVTIGSYISSETRTETFFLNVPCAPEAEETVLLENTCTEDGLSAHVCHGYGVNCENFFAEQVIPAAGHTLYDISQILEKPTATLPGVGLGTCKNCGIIGVEQEIPPIFRDVLPDAFYSRALDHCYDAGWVNGVAADRFAPGEACVRAQVVTFLWRAAGCPEPERDANPFVDVQEADYFYKAVLWAAEKGITTGTDETHFSPMGVCSRSQVVTFLWRAFGQPDTESETQSFQDVAAGSWYEPGVAWAVAEGITTGMSATTFGPNLNCDRAQIVTFLYRAYAQ